VKYDDDDYVVVVVVADDDEWKLSSRRCLPV
jgi:hypothetical protein